MKCLVCNNDMVCAKNWKTCKDNLDFATTYSLYAYRKKHRVLSKKDKLPNNAEVTPRVFVCLSCGEVRLALKPKDLSLYKAIAVSKDY